MSGKLTETEVKIYISDLNVVAAQVLAAGGTLHAPRVYERNVRYDDSLQTLSSRGVVLRLRQDTRARLTYKEAPVSLGDVVTRLEAEVTVDDFELMDIILRRLGFVPFVIYEKYRTTYRLGAAEIVLDEMPYGTFIEVEAPSGEAIRDTLERLGLVGAPRILDSYLGLFMRVKRELQMDCNDLTFANFAGVIVPPEIFYT
jgi:adenylate cyclase class 2